MTTELEVFDVPCSVCNKKYKNNLILYLHVIYNAEKFKDDHVELLARYEKRCVERALLEIQKTEDKQQRSYIRFTMFLLGGIIGCFLMFLMTLISFSLGRLDVITMIFSFIIVITVLPITTILWKLTDRAFGDRNVFTLLERRSETIQFLNEILMGM